MCDVWKSLELVSAMEQQFHRISAITRCDFEVVI